MKKWSKLKRGYGGFSYDADPGDIEQHIQIINNLIFANEIEIKSHIVLLGHGRLAF